MKFHYLTTPLLAPDLVYFVNRDLLDVATRYPPIMFVADRRRDPDSRSADPRLAPGPAACSCAMSRPRQRHWIRALGVLRGDPAAGRDRFACRPVPGRVREGHVADDERQELRHRFLHVVLPDRDQDSAACRRRRPTLSWTQTRQRQSAGVRGRRVRRRKRPEEHAGRIRTSFRCSRKAPTIRPCSRSARCRCASTRCSSPMAARARTAR